MQYEELPVPGDDSWDQQSEPPTQPYDLWTRTNLGEHLWPGDDDVNNLVDVHMSHLRKKTDRPPLQPLIHTVWGRGYRLGPPR